MTTINTTSVTIDTTVPSLSIGQIQLSADKRSTKEKPLTDAERIRRAVLPANYWQELGGTLNGERNQSLTDLLRTALTELGNLRLRDTLAENPMQRTIELADYSVSALLAWNASTAVSRNSITFTREQVEAWFDKSSTRSSLMLKVKDTPNAAAKLVFMRNRFAALAAKNHGLKEPAEAVKLTSLIADNDLVGADASLVTEIIGRLAAIEKSLTDKANEHTVSMADFQ